MRKLRFLLSALLLLAVCRANAEGGMVWKTWEFRQDGALSAREADASRDGWTDISAGDAFKTSPEGAWLRTTVTIPAEINNSPTRGNPLGMHINSDAGGEIYVNGQLQARYDNDHAGMALLTRSARPGEQVRVSIRAFRDIGDANKEQKLGEAEIVLLDAKRINTPLKVSFDVRKTSWKLPAAYVGLSQGAGMADYNDDTAQRLKDLGVKWFRMDNILTNAVKKGPDGKLVYDWSDLDRRLDFMDKIGCEFIACASYMPEALEAFPNPDRHARPADYGQWEELCYQAARHAISRGQRIKYWEVWNESNAGWLMGKPGEDGLTEYLKLYDATWKGVKRADAKALIGGPCNASGPWNTSPEHSYAVNGEKFMRGLLEHCEKTRAPLDFITWHEYFQTPETIRAEAEVTRAYMKDYPRAAKGVREFMITEWNYAWWPDWPQDHEMGAAWTINSLLRAMIPGRIARPCFFYAKDGDDNFRGGWGMLMGPNRPKAVYNAIKLVHMMAPTAIRLNLDDPEIAAFASTDKRTGRTTVLLLNFSERYGVERSVKLDLQGLPSKLIGGQARIWMVDKDHSNAFNNKDKAELETTGAGRRIGGTQQTMSLSLSTNSVALVELVPSSR
ncbi:MAG: hypothetical protein IT209_10465 [Armatimonadetes bacterium]|nr:hypothetical protein [Armatimonadota bacterium]